MSHPDASELNLTVVVVEDDEAVRDSLKFSLVIEGFAVRAFSSGPQLLAEPSLSPGDCYVVDQNMPG
ncbi:MAG TPA: response regulator, partial [Mesorhizobium sp.]|nr:response regulator [Mesorhizobium sp.]